MGSQLYLIKRDGDNIKYEVAISVVQKENGIDERG